MRSSINVVVLVGPTAIGKTAAAIGFVERIGGEIVSADSMAVYKGMDIGTAKPTREEQSRARFHLIDVADPAKPFSVGEFERLAHQAIDDIARRNPPPVVVGGSGLYVRAAVDGLGPSIPAENAEVRQRLSMEAELHGKGHIYAQLVRVDPESARRIHPSNLKRVIRALEIFETTGVKASVMFEEDSKRARRYPNAQFFGLTMNRQQLYNRIEKRVDSMVKAGLMDEVAGLLARGVDSAVPSMQGLGYREMAGCLRGDYSFDEAVALLKKNTRRFAKRQYTWFRADPRITWIDVDGLSAGEVSEIIKESLLNEQDSDKPAR